MDFVEVEVDSVRRSPDEVILAEKSGREKKSRRYLTIQATREGVDTIQVCINN